MRIRTLEDNAARGNLRLLTVPPDGEALIKTIDVEQSSAQARQMKIYPLRNADIGSVSSAIVQALTKPGTVGEKDKVTAAPESGTQSVVVTASAGVYAPYGVPWRGVETFGPLWQLIYNPFYQGASAMDEQLIIHVQVQSACIRGACQTKGHRAAADIHVGRDRRIRDRPGPWAAIVHPECDGPGREDQALSDPIARRRVVRRAP